jgi:hypothetical protein
MNTTFIMTGGAGRTVCSIPAFEKYHKLNPDDDFKIIVHGWDMLFWSHPILQDRVFNAEQKGLFEFIIKDTKVIVPEPYLVHDFFNERISLIEAFDVAINNTEDHSDLRTEGYLYLTKYEILGAQEFIENSKKEQRKTKCVMTHPYGSGMEILNGKLIDGSNRSILEVNYKEICNHLYNEHHSVVLYASLDKFKSPNDKISTSFEHAHNHLPFYRVFMALISQCDYFVGCDSVGQHIARAFGKPGLILMGATGDKCFSHPEHFKIYRKGIPKYFPWRLAEPDAMYAARTNDGMMDFTEEDMKKIKHIIDEDLNPKTYQSYTETDTNGDAFSYG